MNICNVFIIHSPVDGHLGWFHFPNIVSRVANAQMCKYLHGTPGSSLSYPQERYSWVIWFLVPWETSILISILYEFVPPPTVNKNSSFPTSSPAFAVRFPLGEVVTQSRFSSHCPRAGPPCFLRQGLSLNLELHNSATLAGKWLLQLCSPLRLPVSWLQMWAVAPAFYVGDGNPNSTFSCLQRTTHGANKLPSPAQAPFSLPSPIFL